MEIGEVTGSSFSTVPGAVRVGFTLSDRLLLESNVGFIWSSIERAGGESVSGWSADLRTGFSVLLGGVEGARPYVRGEFGTNLFGGGDGDGVTRWFAGGAGGVRIPLSAGLTGRVEASLGRMFEGDGEFQPATNRFGLAGGFSVVVG